MIQIVINYNGRFKYFQVPYAVARAVDVLIHDKSLDPKADDELDKKIETELQPGLRGLSADYMVIDEEAK